MKSHIKMFLVFLIFLSAWLGFLFFSNASDALVYSIDLSQALDDPSLHYKKKVRIEGTLKQGSILFRKKPCEWKFVLQDKGRTMFVRFAGCVVPDTFRDNYAIRVSVQGQLLKDNHFLASEIVPKCPSKYEMKNGSKSVQ